MTQETYIAAWKGLQAKDSLLRPRIELTLTSKLAMISYEQRRGTTMRAALANAAAGLSWSMYWIITGVLFVGPWLLMGWI